MMEASFLSPPEEALQYFNVTEQDGLSDAQVRHAVNTYGRNGTVHLHGIPAEEQC